MQLNDCRAIRRYESMLFNSETTARDDYRVSDLLTYPPTTYKAKKRPLKFQNPIQKDVHTLSDYKYKIPFTLYLKRKEIVQTDPRTIQESYVQDGLEDHDQEEVRKTRPRIFMCPALNLDDVQEPARQLLVDDMYSTSTNSALQEGAEKILAATKNCRAPLLDVYAPADVMKLPRLHNEPVVSPEWRMETVQWDARRMRGYIDTTKDFWLDQKPMARLRRRGASSGAFREAGRPNHKHTAMFGAFKEKRLCKRVAAQATSGPASDAATFAASDAATFAASDAAAEHEAGKPASLAMGERGG